MAIKTIDPQGNTSTDIMVSSKGQAAENLFNLSDKTIPCAKLADAYIKAAASIIASAAKGTEYEVRVPEHAADYMHHAVITALVEKYEDGELNINKQLLMIEHLEQNK